MPPKGKGGKSKAGEAPPSGGGGEVKAFQTCSSKAGLQVCLVLASARPSLPAHLLITSVGGVAPVNVVPRRPYSPIPQTAHSE